MKNTLIILSFLTAQIAFGQDTTQVKQTKKISNLLEKVKDISNEHIDNKEQVINKSKIDGLMFKIDEIKTEQPIVNSSEKQDSLLSVITSLQKSNFEKDSLIIALKNQLTKQQPNQNTSKLTPKTTNNYIVLGAYLNKSNAEKQVRNLHKYHLEIVSLPSGKLHYVVYSLRTNEKITPTLFKFRNQIEPNAWIISF